MAKSSKLVAAKRGRVLLVRRRRDRLWTFPGGRKRARESAKDCLRREIKEELPKLRLGQLELWREIKAKNRRSGRRMSVPSLSQKKCPAISQSATGAKLTRQAGASPSGSDSRQRRAISEIRSSANDRRRAHRTSTKERTAAVKRLGGLYS